MTVLLFQSSCGKSSANPTSPLKGTGDTDQTGRLSNVVPFKSASGFLKQSARLFQLKPAILLHFVNPVAVEISQ